VGLQGRTFVRADVENAQLTRLYRQFGPVIFARCRNLLGENAAAEDATQETFLRVHRHLERTPEEALGWTYRIATNYCHGNGTGSSTS
jgi:RNA polymerase sigma-70 factor (ECF subfamily)